MPPVVLQFLKSKTFKALVGVIATALAAYASSGCSGAQPPRSPALDAFECRVAVLAPFVAEAAPQVVAAVSAGQVDPVALLLSLGLTPAEIVALAKAYQACTPAPVAPADAGPDAAIAS